MRLADYLLRWTGDVTYADYWERNLTNGITAQQCWPEPEYEESLSMFQRPDLPRGMIAYFLPLHAGGFKRWGRPTEDFWCCHGSLVQAHSRHAYGAHYVARGTASYCPVHPHRAYMERDGVAVSVTLTEDGQTARGRAPQQPGLPFARHVPAAGRVHAEDSPALVVGSGAGRHPRTGHRWRRPRPVQLLRHPSAPGPTTGCRRPAQAPLGLAAPTAPTPWPLWMGRWCWLG